MKKLFLAGVYTLLASWGAQAADLPPKPIAKASPPVVSTTGPFYLFAHAGAGFSPAQNELTLSGVTVAGSGPKQWPTGMMVGGGVGVGANTSFGYVGAELETDYDFTRSSVGCDPTGTLQATYGVGCLGNSKNSWFFAEKLMWSPFPTVAQLTGQLPLNAQPAHWPVPITTSASWVSNLMILPEAGLAQRTVSACMLNPVDGSMPCDTKLFNGLLGGLQLRVPMSASSDLRLEYNYIWYNQSITHNDSTVFPIQSKYVSPSEQRLMFGFNWHL